MARHGTFLVPTLVTYESSTQFGEELGMPPDSCARSSM